MAIRAGCILELSGLYRGKICVAVMGFNNDFAVYVQSRADQFDGDLVAKSGDKLSEVDGREAFPELKNYRYRS
jgi:hypothetical protein